mgnify:CR=1 FL=1
MKLFQKTSVAVALTVVMIAAAIGIGQVRGSSAPAVPQAAGLDKSLSTSSYATWISDEAEVLSDQEEQQICLYNANWVARYDSLIAVATVREVSGDIADYAYALGADPAGSGGRHPGGGYRDQQLLSGSGARLSHDG